MICDPLASLGQIFLEENLEELCFPWLDLRCLPDHLHLFPLGQEHPRQNVLDRQGYRLNITVLVQTKADLLQGVSDLYCLLEAVPETVV